MRNICVFCGSSPGKNPDFIKEAEKLGKEMARRGYTLVYGASDLGIMGAISKSVLENGGDAIGIMPEIFNHHVYHPNLTELIITKDMSDRKKLMVERSDGFISLPGGIGTFEELLEVITLGQIGYHTKPSAILNVSGYYDKFIEFLDYATEQRFIKQAHRDSIIISSDINELLDKMEKYNAVIIDKWIDSEVGKDGV